MITQIEIYGINSKQSGHDLIKTHEASPELTDQQFERAAYDYAARWLDRRYPGEWCYRYAKLVDGVTVETPGVVVAYPFAHDENDQMVQDAFGKFVRETKNPYINGVTDISLVADDGFTGQFQWIGYGAGSLIPAYIHITDPEKQAEYERRRAIRETEEARIAAEVAAKVAALPTIRFVEGGETLWQSWVNANTDGYGGAVMIFAEQWARLMQAEINFPLAGDDAPLNAKALFSEIAERTSHEANTVGLTGFMYGAAVSMLAQAWIFGEELRRWHNQQYGVSDDATGTVNPALLKIGE